MPVYFPDFLHEKKGKRYLKRMLATPSEYVTCSFACSVSFSASVQPGFALFSSCLSLSLAPSLKPFLLALILFTIHLEYRWITNTHLKLGFLSTSEMSTIYMYALTKESNHSNIHCHVEKMKRMRRCHAVRRSIHDTTLTSLGTRY